MNRPLKPIDWDVVDKMMHAQCLGTEIAAYFDMHPDTFYRRVQEKSGMGFTEYSTQKKEVGKAKIRISQYKTALEGNTSMQIWWGKNHLGQKDQPVTTEEFNKNLGKLLDTLKQEEERELQDA